MFRTLSALCLIFLFGCTSSHKFSQDWLVKEKLLIESDNNQALVILYKEQLKNRNDVEVMIKLSQAYLKLNDTKSALFFIEKVNLENEPTELSLFIEASALNRQGNNEKSRTVALSVLDINKKNTDAINLLGVISSELGAYEAASEYFKKAKSLYHDDDVVSNNLAILHILKGEYQDAVDLLMPIFNKDSGNRKVKSNLLFALAKSKQIELWFEVSRSRNDPMWKEKYIALQRSSLAIGENNEV
jgi:tight adherence protein D